MDLKKLIVLPILLLVSAFTITNVKAAGFNVTRNVTGVSNPVTNTFTYTVEEETGNPTTVAPPSGTYQINMTNQAVSSNTASKTVAPLIAESVWTSLNYQQPGVYKFKVKETGTTNSTTYPLDTATYTVTIYVTNELVSGVPTGNLIKTYVGAQKNGTGTKIDGNSNVTYTSEANLSQIRISSGVSGDAAQLNKYFKYKITINGNPGDTFTITGQDASVPYGDSTIPTSSTYTVGSTPQYVYLKGGQTAIIGLNGSLEQIPVGTTYEIELMDADDYDTFINGSTTPSKTTGTMTVSNTVASNEVSFVNNKGIPAPTGMVFKILPFIILLVISVVGLYIIMKTQKPESSKNKK